MVFLGKELIFPPVSTAGPDGILAIGGDLTPDRLLLAYRNGIFPWYNQGEPIIWYSPDPRMVLFPEELKTSKSMRRFISNHPYRITINQDFEGVIENCRTIPRSGQKGSWITREMKNAYISLHRLGHAKSVEVWDRDELVGGLYGVDLGQVFCGESMFSKLSNTSKLAFTHLVRDLDEKGYRLVDCQVYNDHLASLGAREMPRAEFITILKRNIALK